MFFEFVLEISVPRDLSGQILVSLHQEFRRPARQIEHLFGRHPEIIASRILLRCLYSFLATFHDVPFILA